MAIVGLAFSKGLLHSAYLFSAAFAQKNVDECLNDLCQEPNNKGDECLLEDVENDNNNEKYQIEDAYAFREPIIPGFFLYQKVVSAEILHITRSNVLLCSSSNHCLIFEIIYHAEGSFTKDIGI